MSIDPNKLSPDAAYLLQILQENDRLKAENKELQEKSRRFKDAQTSLDQELDLRGAPLRDDNGNELSLMGRLRQYWVHSGFRKYLEKHNLPTCYERRDNEIYPIVLSDIAYSHKGVKQIGKSRPLPNGWGDIQEYQWGGWIWERIHDRNKCDIVWKAIRKVPDKDLSPVGVDNE